MAHSEHPWRNCHGGNCKCGTIFDASGNVYIASVYHPSDLGDGVNGPDAVPDVDTFKANYKLITAAPDLLAICQKILKIHEGCAPGFGLFAPDVRDELRAAIKRATEGDPYEEKDFGALFKDKVGEAA